MCNLYRHKSSYQEVADLFKTRSNLTNMTEFDLEIFPDYPAPIVRKDAHGERELAMLRWGMPSPDKAITSTGVNYGTTNIRNPHYDHWKKWLGKEFRCLVPATSFSEYGPKPDPVTKRKPLHWFALNEDQPMFCFAGLWTPWRGIRKAKEGQIDVEVFGFLTTNANAVVKPIHEKAMPVILRTREEFDIWLNGSPREALQLQRPLPDSDLIVLAPPKKIEEEPLLL